MNDSPQRTQSARRFGLDDLTQQVIGAAIEVHRALGPGLLESTYELCLCRELSIREIPFLVVDDRLLVEIKAVDRKVLNLAEEVSF